MNAVMVVLAIAIMLGLIGLGARRIGYASVGSDAIVRCRDGHLFTTLWIPGVSLKSIRFGMTRFQYCPVGRHWTFVAPVRESELTEEQIIDASRHHDVRIP